MTIETAPPELHDSADSTLAPIATGPRAKEADEISLLDLLICVAERKRVVAWFTVGFAILAVVVSFILPTRYTATVTLLPPQQNTSLGSALASQLSGIGSVAALAGGSFGFRSPNEMYVSMLKSRVVEDAMVQHFGLMEEYGKHYPTDARKAFERRADVSGNGKDGLIHISVEDRDPRRAADLANGYVDQFRNLSEHLAITEASERRLFFERELVQAKDKLAGAEEALKQTEMKTGVIQLDSQARALIESGAALRAQITAREVQIQGMQTYATGENAQLIQAQRELEGLRAQLAKLGGSADGDGLIVPKGRVPEAGLEYIRRLREVKYSETIFDILARQFEIAKLDEARQGALIQVVDPAVPPDKRSFPKRTLIVIAATIIGLLLGVLSAVLIGAFEHLRHASEAALKLNLLRRALSFKTMKDRRSAAA
ncbi:MAG TPA: Wzz/FepE/Etk N-terminal domain-containing protein [Terracidiphilus sp.]|nr:Wzz/FepE/Etk N-terminal domain-containing protein [Terracidiphilus sp.]